MGIDLIQEFRIAYIPVEDSFGTYRLKSMVVQVLVNVTDYERLLGNCGFDFCDWV